MKGRLSLGVLLVLTGCGAVSTPGGTVDEPQPAASEELIGQGTVLSKDGGPTLFCLGGVMESYPPQCSGPELIGWDWSAVEQSQSASGVTWGTYAVQGTWDGSALTVTQPPIPLSLYDPPAPVDPRTDKESPGVGDEADLVRLQEELFMAKDAELLTAWVENGYLFVTVVYDDGALQDAYDAKYGQNIIAVQSALLPVNS
ncbi:hypothetical protein BJ994_000362 [Arthrobacter pigmenti]|uniref:Uncharacterized protein n=1 Tax=Arthrobacter pigmenti TaxID=271432 RepID=A0A846RQA4_9MICC|nr:hypothetical protein [Arthrobacter pigmenti]NJC21286.1 hypothetical protein [Arthrobacter pigmenti]